MIESMFSESDPSNQNMMNFVVALLSYGRNLRPKSTDVFKSVLEDAIETTRQYNSSMAHVRHLDMHYQKLVETSRLYPIFADEDLFEHIGDYAEILNDQINSKCKLIVERGTDREIKEANFMLENYKEKNFVNEFYDVGMGWELPHNAIKEIAKKHLIDVRNNIKNTVSPSNYFFKKNMTRLAKVHQDINDKFESTIHKIDIPNVHARYLILNLNDAKPLFNAMQESYISSKHVKPVVSALKVYYTEMKKLESEQNLINHIK